MTPKGAPAPDGDRGHQVDPVRVARSVAGHRALVDALAAGDAARFSTELVEHMKVVTEVD